MQDSSPRQPGASSHDGVMSMVHRFEQFCGMDRSTPDALAQVRAGLERLRSNGLVGVVCNVSEDNYLNDEEAWRFFGQGLEEALKLGLRVWIYDEDGYPSGTAQGQVVRECPQFEAVGLLRLVDRFSTGPVLLSPPLEYRYAAAAWAWIDNARIDLKDKFDATGNLCWTAPGSGWVERFICRRAFEGAHATLNVHAVRRYINVLDPAAVRAFIDKTHAQYLKRFPELMGRVEAIFTDEPSFMTTYHPMLPQRYAGKIRIEDTPNPCVPPLPMVPWWPGLLERFEETFGYDLRPWLGRLFENPPDESLNQRAITQNVRQDFYQLLGRQYAAAFFKQTQDYLDESGLALTGHLLHEEPLYHHVGSHAHLLQPLAQMRIPGCDLLTGRPQVMADSLRLLTPKYASSAAHLYGRRQVMSEVSDWEERNQGEYASLAERFASFALQAMLGITTFTSYYSWKEFKHRDQIRQLHEAVGRVCGVVRQGRHVAGIALLYPIRAAWSEFTPTDHWVGFEDRPSWVKTLDENLHAVARGLFETQRDFDFVDEELLLQARLENGELRIADENFRALLLPPGTILPEPLARVIKDYLRQGGTVIAFQPEPVVRTGAGPRCNEILLSAQVSPEAQLNCFSDHQEAWLKALAPLAPPALQLTPAATNLFVRHAQTEHQDLYLVVNISDALYQGNLACAQEERPMEVWDPWENVAVQSVPFLVPGYSARVVVAGRP